jgi:predicted Zn-dependent protease with MMP-like domain
MNIEHVQEVVLEIAEGTPEQVAEVLYDVQVLVTRNTEWWAGELTDIASDAKGVYLGTFPAETDDEVVIERPRGMILLVADNIANKDECRQVFLHEIGHALGLDEHEVAALGL